MENTRRSKGRFLTRILSFFRKIILRKRKGAPQVKEKMGKGWANSRPHPYDPTKTLWDFLILEKDSTRVLHELNKAIRDEKNKKDS